MSDAMQHLSAALADRYTIERELGAGRMVTAEPVVVLHWIEEVKRLMAATGIK